jgi:hypothetical protein
MYHYHILSGPENISQIQYMYHYHILSGPENISQILYHYHIQSGPETRGSQEPVIAHLVFNLTSL